MGNKRFLASFRSRQLDFSVHRDCYSRLQTTWRSRMHAHREFQTYQSTGTDKGQPRLCVSARRASRVIHEFLSNVTVLFSLSQTPFALRIPLLHHHQRTRSASGENQQTAPNSQQCPNGQRRLYMHRASPTGQGFPARTLEQFCRLSMPLVISPDTSN
jgi:hypothetical protein